MDFLLGTKVLEKRKSKFNGEIKVIRNLAFGTYIQAGGITQSGGIIEDIWRPTLKKLHNSKLIIRNSLILGLGGGTITKIIRKFWPKANIIGVDIDPVIVELGKKYLNLKGIKIEITDACDWIVKNKKDFDLVIVDIYKGRDFPQKFEEEKFLKSLTKFKIVIFNRLYYGEKRPEAMKFGQKLEKVFPKVEYFYPQANLMFVCYN
jgi:spermidine synthase